MIRKLLPLLGFIVITAIFFWQFLFKGLFPIPADTVVGLYHPYRDLYAKDYPNGIPFKNFLITDPVRQQYPWRKLSIDKLKEGSLPKWNTFSLSGTPNIANFQSAVFYPLNLTFFLLPFDISWSFLILLQPLLAGIFLYYFLRNLKLDEYSSFFGGVIFAFSGFFTTWLEWGTILHTALWLPLILLAIDKIASNLKNRRNILIWLTVLILSSVSSFFAGHLQTFFYLSLLVSVYILIRFSQSKEKKKLGIIFLVTWLLTFIITCIQLVPTLNFIFLSGRSSDQILWQKEGWFIPWQHLVQFITPDFFGNPTTLNYWGAWNYGELTGYAGIASLTLSLLAIIFRRDKKTLFSGLLLLTALIFALPNVFSKIPFVFNLPFISTAQPTRLLFLADFAISVLGALGLNYLISKGKIKQVITPIIIVAVIFALLYGFTRFGNQFGVSVDNLSVAGRNILFPGLIFVISSFLIATIVLAKKKFKNVIILLLILVTVADLLRFSWKFNTFSKKEFLYPETKSLSFIKNNIGDYRIVTTDARILAPNFSIMHGIRSVEGYDPLYLERYGEFISAINRDKPYINPPFGFNRIIRVESYSSNLVDLLGVKYLLTLSEVKIPGFTKVFEEGQTMVYENKEVVPRAFFVIDIKIANSKQNAINLMFNSEFDPLVTAVIEENFTEKINRGTARIVKYSEDEVIVETENSGDGFLVLTDSFYPSWHARINSQEVKIYRTDYNFRGVLVPAGKQTVIFKNQLL